MVLGLARRWLSYLLVPLRDRTRRSSPRWTPWCRARSTSSSSRISPGGPPSAPTADPSSGPSRSARPGSAFAARAARLRPLARGQAGELVTSLRQAAAEEPQLTLRFVRQLLERLEGEDKEVRIGEPVPAEAACVELLESLAAAQRQGTPAARRRGSRASSLDRTRGLLEGLSHVETSAAGKAHALSPRREAFAGNVRLAPADPLPWPFPTAAGRGPLGVRPRSSCSPWSGGTATGPSSSAGG